LHLTLSIQRYPKFLIIINHDYKVVIDPYSHHHIIMKFINLRLNIANKPSPMSEGVAETRINNQPCMGINLTTRHTQAQRHHSWQPFTTWSKGRAGSNLALVPSSMRIPRRTHRGWPNTIPYNIQKEVGYHPTRRHVKLLSLGIPYVPYAPVHFKCLFNRA
jgi:hypothetical protein